MDQAKLNVYKSGWSLPLKHNCIGFDSGQVWQLPITRIAIP